MENLISITFPLTVFIASLAGSWHCAVMCGGLITASAPSPLAAGWYHFGRLLGYGCLGIVAGAFGKSVLSSLWAGPVSFGAALILSLSFILVGIHSWSGQPAWRMPAGFLELYRRGWSILLVNRGPASPKAFSAGFLSVFLPCGWLYTFVLAAIAAKSPWKGAVILGAFWAGTLPILSVAPLILRNVLEPLRRRMPKLVASLLIGLGLLTLGMKMKGLPLSPNPAGPNLICHGPRGLHAGSPSTELPHPP